MSSRTTTCLVSARPGRLLRGAACALGALLIAAGGDLALAQRDGAPKFSEYEVKAAFLFNFLQFVEWPDSVTTNAGAPIVIGVLGDCPFGKALDETIQDETLDGHPLMIKRTRQVADIKACQLVFICRSEKARLKEILKSLRGGGALTVSDIEPFCQHGGMIGLVSESGRIRFEINQEAAEQGNVKMSSKLLRLARQAGK